MKRIALILAVVLLALPAFAQDAPPPAAPTDKEIVGMFTAKAYELFEAVVQKLPTEENPRATCLTYEGLFSVTPTDGPGKRHFFTADWYSKPTTFSYDVERTDSLVAPYKGYLKIPGTGYRKTLWVSTQRKGDCHEKTPDACIKEFTGKIVKRFNYPAQAFEAPITASYAFEGGEWKFKGFDLDPLTTWAAPPPQP